MPAPLGNQNAARARVWRDAIERALDVWPDRAPAQMQSSRGLHEAAYLFVTQMMETKDLGFFREFGDRIEGKPAQALTGEGGGPIETRNVTEVVTRGIKPDTGLPGQGA